MAETAELDVKALGISVGAVAGGSMALLGVAAMFGYGSSAMEMIAGFYIGFDSTPAGIVLGAIYGFIDGAIGGVAVAWLYNYFSDRF